MILSLAQVKIIETTTTTSILSRQRAKAKPFGTPVFVGISEDRYTVRLAENAREVESALRLRYKVFNVELGNRETVEDQAPLEFDAYDFKSRHLIIIENQTGETVGTYRLNSIKTAGGTRGFYSFNEFTIEDLPVDVLHNGIEIGRACIAAEHRNTKALFLLWKALFQFLEYSDKRYFFGCCSIFTQDEMIGEKVFRMLSSNGHFHEDLFVKPRKNGLILAEDSLPESGEVGLPNLFNMYLRIGAKVCSPPMIDREFGTIDFFVVFDAATMNKKYRTMFGV
jgi:putative hemolysin